MQEKSKKTNADTLFLVILITVILALEAVGGIINYAAYVKEKRCSSAAEGVLLEWRKWYGNRSKSYYPFVEYRVGDEIYTGSSNVKAGQSSIEEGEPVTVYYNPSNPYEFYIEGYDLKAIRSLGGSFMIWGVAAAAAKLICAVLNRIHMNEKKRVRAKEIVITIFILAAFCWIVTAFSGFKTVVAIAVLLAPFVLYVKIRKRRNHPDDPAKDRDS